MGMPLIVGVIATNTHQGAQPCAPTRDYEYWGNQLRINRHNDIPSTVCHPERSRGVWNHTVPPIHTLSDVPDANSRHWKGFP